MAVLQDFKNNVKPNWCPGCGDYAVQMALQKAVVQLGMEPHELALVCGIGCSGRFSGYIYAYGMHTTHGRALPFAQGLKLANHKLNVIACGGDGDGMAIGLGHTFHAIRRNINITYVLMDNHVYGLTKGQTSPRSDLGFKTKTTPTGNIETPVSTLEMALAAGATFIGQGFSLQLQELTDLLVAAVRHPGFSLVNVFSPCVTFNKVNTYEWFKDKLVDVKDIGGYDAGDKGAVLNHVLEHEGLLTGLLYENLTKPSYEKISGLAKNNQMQSVKKLAPDVFSELLEDFY
ncbi:MAG: 2-oxoacid:ferredoxin oxidoreductase subunit beta [Acidaminococcaceae bacterium]